ncbi:MAG: hypothetical protein ABJF50_21140 [Paracoccaceae bacterium]
MKDTDETTIPDLAAAMEKAAHQQHHGTQQPDLLRYQGYLEGSDLTQSQKDEVPVAWWSIISTFVELGFRSHPVQQACGKHGTELDQTENSESTGMEPKIDMQQQETDVPAI